MIQLNRWKLIKKINEKTVLLKSIEKNNVELIKLLLSNSNVNINIKNTIGLNKSYELFNPNNFMITSIFKEVEGCFNNGKNKGNYIAPLSFAKKMRNKEIVSILHEYEDSYN